MKCLFLGYDKKKTRLITLLERKGILVKNIKRDLKKNDLNKYDLYISFGYRKIIPKKYLKILRKPIINLHLSYLPYNKGSHPNYWSFVENTPSGVTIHEITRGVDQGPILFQKKIYFDHKKNKNLTFKSSYQLLFQEIENLFEKKLILILKKKYKKKIQKKIYSFHYKKDLPKNLKNWNTKIFSYLKKLKDG